MIYANNSSTLINYPAPLTTGSQTAFIAINNVGQILGSFSHGYSTSYTYFLYSKGVFTDLNLPTGYTPTSLNDEEQIVGYTAPATEGFIATPVPEIDTSSGAGAIALLAGALLIFCGRRIYPPMS